MDKTTIKNTDLGHDWYATSYSDGSMTIRNPEKGQRIDLPRQSVDTLRSIFTELRAAA